MKSSSIAIAVLLGMTGATAANAEPMRLAQTLAADIVPPYEVFTIIRSMGMRPLGRPHYRGRFYVVRAVDPRGQDVRVVVDAYAARVVSVRPLDRRAVTEYGAPPVYRRYESGPPEPAPRYVPPAQVRPAEPDPRYSAPRPAPDDDDDIYPDNQPDEFDSEEDGDLGSLPPRTAPRSIGAPRVPPAAQPSTRSAAAVTPPKTPLPRPRPQQLASAAPAEKPDAPATVTPVAPEAKAEPETKSEPEAKSEGEKPAEGKAEAKAEAPKSGVRIIEIKKPEPRI